MSRVYAHHRSKRVTESTDLVSERNDIENVAAGNSRRSTGPLAYAMVGKL